MRPSNKKVLDAVAVSTNSSEIKSDFVVACSAIVNATGTITGTVKLQASNDNVDPTSWADIASATVAVSTASPVMIAKTDLCYNFVRVVFTKSGGTGTVTVNYQGIGLN